MRGKMTLKKKILLLSALIFSVCFIVYFVFFKTPPYSADRFSVHFIDVGQAGCALVIAPGGSTMMVDTGSNYSSPDVIKYLRRLGIDSLDILVITHFDEDHVGGADEIISHLKRVDRIYAPPIPDHDKEGEKNGESNENLDRMITAANEKGVQISHPSVYDVLPLSNEAESVVLFVSRKDSKGKSIDNIVLKTTYKKTSVLFTADIGEEEELILLDESRHLLAADIMSAAHHGSAYSNTRAFVSAVSPDFVAVSCGILNSFGHPTQQALKVFEEVGASVYRTDANGNIVFSSDGESISVKYEREKPVRE